MSNKLSRFIDRKRSAAHWATVEREWEKRPLVCAEHVSDNQLTIIVTTYHERFDSCLKRIIKQLTALFHGTRIIVVANGNHDEAIQSAYLNNLEGFLAELPCVDLIKHTEPVGLSQMWNDAIALSCTNKLLVLNDDLVLEGGFETDINGLTSRHPLQIINKSWSHFVVTKETINKVGWFDERFQGIGNEDWDYEARIALAGLTLHYVESEHVLNEVLKPGDYSYGSEMEVANQKYSKMNLDFFEEKWESSNKPMDGYVFVPGAGYYVKPRIEELSFRF